MRNLAEIVENTKEKHSAANIGTAILALLWHFEAPGQCLACNRDQIKRSAFDTY